ALGIGANTAVFSVVNAVLLRPLPYRDPSRIVMIWDTQAKRGQTRNVTSPADYLSWQSGSTAFEQIAAMDLDISNLTGLGEPEEIAGQSVTPSFFAVLGAGPALGRVFTDDEARTHARLIILSNGFWEKRLHSDSAVLGRTVELDRKTYTVIGVMPAGFEFLNKSEYWLPFYIDPQKDYRTRGGRFLMTVGRLKSGVTIATAQAGMNALASRLEKDYPEFHKGWGVRLVDIRDETAGGYRRPLLILLGAVCLVLLIACVNVANLLLSRAAARRKEMAIRTSLGAGPWRLARQLFVESALLAGIGGGLGILLALWGGAALKAIAPPGFPRLTEVGLDWRVASFTSVVSMGAALLFGMAPALQGARVRPNDTLKEASRPGGGTARSRRIPNLLVMLEFALSLALLAGAGLLIRSFNNLLSVDTGFRADHLLTARILLPGTYKDPETVAFFRDAVHRIEALPGVRSASAVTFMPFGGLRPGTGFTIENRPAPPAGEAPFTEVRSVLPGYFRTMGIPLLRGRDFTERDGSPEHPVLIVNQTLAKKHWPNDDPIGKRITVYIGREPAPGVIVGIVADTRDKTLDGGGAPTVYYPHPGLPISLMSFVVRTSGDPAALGKAVTQVVHSLDPNQPVSDIQTMDQMLVRSVSTQRFQTVLLGVFAALALALAVVGIYGVISYSVAQRTNEFGIRMALGAGRGDVLRLVLRQGGGILLGGLALGLAGALALTRTIAGLLFEVKPSDPLTFAAVAVLLTGVGLAAIAAPARRATRVDPLTALRYE
ncbi:MAG TPA: ABC transporter permease, partial [Bryobacteraceae bacterium]